MTAATLPPRAVTRIPTAPAAGRLLWIEIKRNAVLWVLPLLAVLVYVDTFRTAGGYPPVWTVRALAVPDRLLTDFAAFAGGFCAWAGSREGRRKTEDLLGTTARPAWTRRLAALASTMFWLVLAFLAAVAVLYVQIAHAVLWGGPPLWPVAVGVVALVTICVVGFTAGALFPGRFTAPLAAVGAVVLHIVGTHAVNDPNMPNVHDLLSLGTSVPPYDMGLFYRVPLDVPIAQIMFMGGITVAAAGLLASCTAYVLIGTATLSPAGWNIPALHDAAAAGRFRIPRIAPEPGSTCACTRRSAATWAPSRRRSTRWPRRSRGCRARRSAPSRYRTAIPSMAASSSGRCRCTSSP